MIESFLIVEPSNDLAVTMADGVYRAGMSVTSQADNHKSKRKQFHLGKQRSVFSKKCIRLMISASQGDTLFWQKVLETEACERQA